MIRLAASHPEWVLGFEDEVWFSRFALPRLHAWTTEKPLRVKQQEADKAVQQLITGGDVNPAEVLTTVQKADMSFRMMMQIRNKLVAAFQEVNNIRI